MRHPFALVALLAFASPSLIAEEAVLPSSLTAVIPQALPWVPPCRVLCQSLEASIRSQPDSLVMRLEDALVIDETCAAELVTAAMDAVGGSRDQADKILQTALKMVPGRSTLVMQAVHGYTPASDIRAAVIEDTAAEAMEEIRRPEPAGENAPAEEIRRAEVLPQPGEEIRRAGMVEASAVRQ